MPHAGARILIVDGQVTVAHLVSKIFGVAGLPNAHVAFDTLTAREQMEAKAPDIVVLDARIAPMNVTAFITLARKLTNGQAVTLMMTTSRTAEVVDAAREAGIDGILVKPFTPNDLRSELTSAKERKGSSQVRSRERAQQPEVILD